jgi:uncharacterized protein
MNIPKYPDFRPLEIEDMNIFNKAFNIKPVLISEFTFANLYGWREIYGFEAAFMDPTIILRSGSGGQNRFFEPIGEGDTRSAIEHILEDTGGAFIRIPEATRAMFENGPRFKIVADIDNYDYLYNTADLIALAGKKYDGKRNLIKKLKSMHEYEYIKLDPSHVDECFEFEELWCTIRDCDSVEGLNNERRAIREMIKNCELFGLFAGAVKLEGRIRAVAIGQRLNGNTLVMHVLKADPNITGLYQLIFNEFLIREAKGFDFVNLEQDLGIEGLRKSKLSYHPVSMIKKFSLSLTKNL